MKHLLDFILKHSLLLILTFVLPGSAWSQPSIVVQGNSITITQADITPSVSDGTFFGNVEISGTAGSQIFTIENAGTAPLNILGSPLVKVSGLNPEDFSVTMFPASPLAAAASTSFMLEFSPLGAGIRRAIVTFNSDDSINNPFAFAIEGVGQVSSGPGIDSDSDGLTDSDEVTCGTDPNNPDTDGDEVVDGQEKLDGSDPLDGSSFVFKLDKTFCSDWNGFIGMQYNIAEFTNFTSDARTLRSSLLGVSGDVQSSGTFQVEPGAQSDLLVHDMPGWSLDATGTVCSQVLTSSAKDGDIDGRMLMYRPDGLGNFDFVLVMPFSNPLAGPVFVQFNTFHPSLDPAEFGFFAANWLTVTNSDSNSEAGELIVYADNGSVLETIGATIPAGGRQDFGIHQYGANRVGLLEWRPVSSSAKFRVTLNRYVYDGISPVAPVKEAVSLPAVRGSLQTLTAPVDTRNLTSVLEISNASSAASSIEIVLADSVGQNVLNTFINLPAKATQHFVLDGFLEDDIGVARVTETSGAEIVVNVMQYGRTATAGISNMYSLAAREALGSVMQGSYNTFLNQECSLLLGNLSGVDEVVNLDLTRFDGTEVLSSESLTVPAQGVLEFDVCALDDPNVFGVVRVESSTPNTIVGNVVRVGEGDNYRIATPVR